MPDANILALLALYLCFPVGVMMFRQWSVEKAAARVIIWYLLFLPEKLVLPISGMKAPGKTELANLALFFGVFIFHRRVLRGSRPWRGILWLLVLPTMGALGSYFTNADVVPGVGIIERAMTMGDVRYLFISRIFNVVMPFVVARAVFRTPERFFVLLKEFVLVGFVYSFLAVIELRLSPMLNLWVYGFRQHSFLQMVREGGYRPNLFMEHGLVVAKLWCGVILLGFAISKPLSKAQLKFRKAKFISWWVMVVLALSNSLGAVFLALLGLIFRRLIKPKNHLKVGLALTLFVFVFAYCRYQGFVETDEVIAYLANNVSEDRAGSLAFRFHHEDHLLAKLRERPWFGWGTIPRVVEYDKWGKSATVFDGEWTIVLSTSGIYGFIMHNLPTLAAFFATAKASKYFRKQGSLHLVGGLAIVLGLYVVDTIPNTSMGLPIVFLSGALVGIAEEAIKTRGQVPAQA